MTHETRFATTADGLYLAYQVVGSGPVDMVMDLHAFAGNVDLIWDEPDWGPLLTGLTEFARLIIHDRRGSGASTRQAPPPTSRHAPQICSRFSTQLGSESPFLGAGASTGAMHALFAATYPDRTSGLVWNYPRPRLAWAPDYPWGQPPDAFEAALAESRIWGTTEQAREQAQNRAAQRLGVPHDERHTLTVDEDAVRRYARVTRNTISPDVAEELTRILWQTDVREILPSVRTPTALVVGDADAPAEMEEAEYVASLMPNASVRVLSGPVGSTDATSRWRSSASSRASSRWQAVSTVLATVLFTDIVDSTSKQAELGDRRWRELVLEHHAAVRGALSRWEGTEHDTAGDGFFASFVGPARAIHCAHEIAAKVSTRSGSRHAPRCTSASARSSMASRAGSRSRSAPGSSALRGPRDVVVSGNRRRTSSRGAGSPSTTKASASSRASRAAGTSIERPPPESGQKAARGRRSDRYAVLAGSTTSPVAFSAGRT